MAKCLFCERKSIFLRVNEDGYCKECVPRVVARRKDEEEKRRKEEEQRIERRRIAEEAARRAAYLEAEANMKIEKAVMSLDLLSHVRDVFFAVDVETTGLSPSNDRIIEISAIRYIGFNPVASFSELVNPGVSIPKVATDVNHITNDMIANARTEKQVFTDFLDFISSSNKPIIFCSHNAQFDMSFIRISFARCGLSFSACYIDTLSLCRDNFKGLSNYKLSTIAKHLHIVQNESHRSNSDASTCGAIFLHLFPVIEEPFIKQKEEIEREKAFEKIREGISIQPSHNRVPLSEIQNGDDFTAGYDAGAHHYYQGEIYYKANKYEEALRCYDLARANGYCTPGLYLSYAILFRKIKDYENEISICEEGIARLGDLKKHELLSRRNRAIELLAIFRERKSREENILLKKKMNQEMSSFDSQALDSLQSRSGRRIRQLNDSGDVICEYDSITAASIAVGVNMKSIRCAATGSQKHAGGYKWEYIDE